MTISAADAACVERWLSDSERESLRMFPHSEHLLGLARGRENSWMATHCRDGWIHADRLMPVMHRKVLVWDLCGGAKEAFITRNWWGKAHDFPQWSMDDGHCLAGLGAFRFWRELPGKPEALA